MAASHLIFTNRHGQHPSFQKIYDPLKKVVFNVLISNEFTSRSGIFKMSSGDLSSRVHCAALDERGQPIYDEDDCLVILGPDEIKKIVKKLDKEDGVLCYEPKSHIVYIKDFLQIVPFGLSAPIVSTAILIEYKNFFIKEYWDDFFFNSGEQVLKYIKDSEIQSEKNAWQKIRDPKNKQKNLKMEDYKDTITTPDMAILRGLIEHHGYDKKNKA